ncbi:MAG: phosphomannomutase [Candidatus Hecatellales archaeon]|nr:MAG: phosphomannomutase [Candidatus Hecatellales archaeon]
MRKNVKLRNFSHHYLKIVGSCGGLKGMAKVFRAYDIRGVYGEDLTPELALRIGMAFGTFLNGGKVFVGGDSRLTSPTLKGCIVAGLASTGCDCFDIGLVPTPTLYFASIHYGENGGVMVTASHNPPQYNGFKLCRGGISYSYETGIGEVEKIVEEGRFRLVSWEKTGKINVQDVLSDYMDYLVKDRVLERKLKVIVDAGNGTCGFTEKIFKALGCEVKVLFGEPDGRFPNHIPDPLKEDTLKTLREKIVEEKADLGIAFDGDGDRVGFVDEKGQIVRGDQAFMLFARETLKRYPNSKIIFNVLGSKALFEEVKALGGIPVMTRVGHSYIHEALLKEKAVLAGEISGHYYFAKEYYGFDDGIFAAVKMVELLGKTNLKLSEMVEKLPKYYSSPEVRIPCSDEKKFRVVDVLREKFEREGYKLITIDGVRVEFEDGWGLVRASNTEPALVLRFEAQTQERLEKIRQYILGETKKVLESV